MGERRTFIVKRTGGDARNAWGVYDADFPETGTNTGPSIYDVLRDWAHELGEEVGFVQSDDGLYRSVKDGRRLRITVEIEDGPGGPKIKEPFQ